MPSVNFLTRELLCMSDDFRVGSEKTSDESLHHLSLIISPAVTGSCQDPCQHIRYPSAHPHTSAHEGWHMHTNTHSGICAHTRLHTKWSCSKVHSYTQNMKYTEMHTNITSSTPSSLSFRTAALSRGHSMYSS